mmetsp:Transcript_59049/g.141028  ORF Transcript_59049/g.141028 Transcript_59049/m.141028 type:complete len:212 (+) Transcript_59049:162-797(+)
MLTPIRSIGVVCTGCTVRPGWLRVLGTGINALILWQVGKLIIVVFASDVLHDMPSSPVAFDVGAAGRPPRGLPREWRSFARVDAHNMGDETHIVVHEVRMLLEESNLTRRPEVQPHPNAGIFELELLTSLLRLSLLGVPRSQMRTLAVIAHLQLLTIYQHLLRGAAFDIVHPRSAITEPLRYPACKAEAMWLTVICQESVNVRISKALLVE